MQFITGLLSTPFGAFTAMMAIICAGDLISKVSKGTIPGALGVTFLLFACFWSGLFPKNIADLAGANAVVFQLCSALLVTNLGTLISRKQMLDQWRTVLICLFGLAGIIGVCWTIGSTLFGRADAMAAAPPLCGGAVATAMVRTQAEAVGNNHASIVAIVCMSMQGVLGYPLVALCLRKEVKRLAAGYRDGSWVPVVAEAGTETKKAVKNETTNIIMIKYGFLTLLAYLAGTYLPGGISMFVWALVIGFAAHELGFIGDDGLNKANTYGFCLLFLMIYLYGGLSSSDPKSIVSVFVTAVTLVVLCAAGMAAVGFVASKIFKKSFWMCWAIALNAYLGFPINVVLTNEALDMNCEPGAERDAISAELMPQMLVASFVCVTIVSVIVAGLLLKYIV